MINKKKASVFLEKRLQNVNAALRLLHFAGPLHRAEISRRLNMRKTSVTNVIAELIRLRFVAEEEPGRWRSRILLNPDFFFTLCASVTPQEIRIARVYLDGRIEDQGTLPLENDTSPDHVIERLAAGMKAFVSPGKSKAVLGCGVAIQGVVNPERGEVIYSANMGGWENLRLGERLTKKLGFPVVVDNDVRCQLWANAWMGRLLNETDNLFYVGILDGVASAMLIHGRMIEGSIHSAGQIGHVRAGHEGRLCRCGRKDCLESYCCLPAILKDLGKAAGQKSAPPVDSIPRLVQSNPAAREALDGMAQRLANTLAGIIAGIQPQILLLGSENRAFSECFKPLVEQHLKEQLMGIDAGRIQIRVTEPVDLATIRGVGAIIIQRRFENIHPFQGG